MRPRQLLTYILNTLRLRRILAGLRSADSRVRCRAAEELARIGDARPVPHLVRLLGDEDWSVQMATARALGAIGDPRAVLALIDAVLGDDEWVAETAADALGEIGDARAVPALLAALRSEELLQRFDGLAARERGPMTSEIFLLLGQTFFDISDLRCAAARALGKIGGAQAVAGLAEALGDPRDSYVREAAGQALEQVGSPEALRAVMAWRAQEAQP